MNKFIFFREENEKELSGPFTEREMQQLYRAKKFSPTAEIYFTNGTMPEVTAKSYLLVQLRSRCGIGCPFINPETLPAKLGRTATKDELRVMGIQIGIKGIREQVKKLDELAKEVEILEGRMEAFLTKCCRHMSVEETQERKKKMDKKKKMESVSLLLDEFPTKFGLNREQRMLRLESDLISIRSSFFSLLSLKWNVNKANLYWKDVHLELMAVAAAKVTPPSAYTPKEKLTLDSLIKMMNTYHTEFILLADFEKVPEKPKTCSRANWLNHVKLAKRFANGVHNMCVSMNEGSSRSLDVKMVDTNMGDAHDWFLKWMNSPLKEQLTELVDYELFKRLKEIEYFFCYFCLHISFNAKQALSHLNHDCHVRKIKEIQHDNVGDATTAFASSCVQLITQTPLHIHNTYTTEFTLPLLKSSLRVPSNHPSALPSVSFLEKIKKKYEAKINGEIDEGRLRDPMYVATILNGIMRRHRSEIGRQLFTEINEYFNEGKYFNCKSCGWMLTSRGRYYRHLENIVHLGLVINGESSDTSEFGVAFNLITFSVNIHARELI